MTKLLNLNQLSAKENRVVQIGDKTYDIKEMSVEDFIETTKVAEAMQKETNYAVQLRETVKLLKRSIPSIEDKVLVGLSLDQMRALTAFVRGEDPAVLVAAHEAMNKEEGDKTEAAAEVNGKK